MVVYDGLSAGRFSRRSSAALHARSIVAIIRRPDSPTKKPARLNCCGEEGGLARGCTLELPQTQWVAPLPPYLWPAIRQRGKYLMLEISQLVTSRPSTAGHHSPQLNLLTQYSFMFTQSVNDTTSFEGVQKLCSSQACCNLVWATVHS